MRRELTIEIESGEKTCASVPGEFCGQAKLSVTIGNPSTCALFGAALRDQDGWLMRCQSCLDAEQPPRLHGITHEYHGDDGTHTKREVMPGLSIGGAWAPLHGTDLLVLCAADVEPEEDTDYVSVIRCRLHDCKPGHSEVHRARESAKSVAAGFTDNRTVLVTCVNGLNRSGLVVALALLRLGHSPQSAIGAVRSARGPAALSNRHFVELILGS